MDEVVNRRRSRSLELEDGVVFGDDHWTSLPFYKRMMLTRQVREKIFHKEPEDWTREEMLAITSWPRLYLAIEGWQFQAFITFVIFANTIVLGMRVDADDKDALGFLVAENLFNILFLVEWIVNIIASGFIWLTYSSNLLDTVLVFGAGVLPVWLIPALDLRSGFFHRYGGVFTVFRVLRVLKVPKLLKKMKQRDLWMLISGCTSSFKSFMWAMVILFFFMYVTAISLRVTVGNDQETIDADVSGVLATYYSSVPDVMWWHFGSLTGGLNWEQTSAVVTKESPSFAVFYAIVVCIGQFVLLNLITAVIVEHAIANADMDSEAEAQAAMLRRKKTVDLIIDLFKDCDTDGNDCVDRYEFVNMLENTKMKRLIRLLELEEDGSQLLELFDLVDLDGSGSLSLDEYKDIFFKIMRPPNSKDLLRIGAVLFRCEAKLDFLLGLPPPTCNEDSVHWRKYLPEAKKDCQDQPPPHSPQPPPEMPPPLQSEPKMAPDATILQALSSLGDEVRSIHARLDEVSLDVQGIHKKLRYSQDIPVMPVVPECVVKEVRPRGSTVCCETYAANSSARSRLEELSSSE